MADLSYCQMRGWQVNLHAVWKAGVSMDNQIETDEETSLMIYDQQMHLFKPFKQLLNLLGVLVSAARLPCFPCAEVFSHLKCQC